MKFSSVIKHERGHCFSTANQIEDRNYAAVFYTHYKTYIYFSELDLETTGIKKLPGIYNKERPFIGDYVNCWFCSVHLSRDRNTTNLYVPNLCCYRICPNCCMYYLGKEYYTILYYPEVYLKRNPRLKVVQG